MPGIWVRCFTPSILFNPHSNSWRQAPLRSPVSKSRWGNRFRELRCHSYDGRGGFMGSVLGHSPVSRSGSLPSVEKAMKFGNLPMVSRMSWPAWFHSTLTWTQRPALRSRLNLIISCGLSEIFTVKSDSNEDHWGDQMKWYMKASCDCRVKVSVTHGDSVLS